MTAQRVCRTMISKHKLTPWQSTPACTSSSYLRISISSGSRCFSQVKILSIATKTLNAASLSLVFVISFSHSGSFKIPIPFVLLLVPQPSTVQLSLGIIAQDALFLSDLNQFFFYPRILPNIKQFCPYKRNNDTLHAILLCKCARSWKRDQLKYKDKDFLLWSSPVFITSLLY